LPDFNFLMDHDGSLNMPILCTPGNYGMFFDET
jgi:hypothetical protein